MTMRTRLKRLFTIKTRFEAFLVIYAIALGAVERGLHYLTIYPGWTGWLLAVTCTGVVFVAGAKLLDAVRPERKPTLRPVLVQRRISRSRPRSRLPRSGSGSPISLRRD